MPGQEKYLYAQGDEHRGYNPFGDGVGIEGRERDRDAAMAAAGVSGGLAVAAQVEAPRDSELSNSQLAAKYTRVGTPYAGGFDLRGVKL